MTRREMRERIHEGTQAPDFHFMVITRHARTKLELKPLLKGVKHNVIRVPVSFAILFFHREENNVDIAALDPESHTAALLFIDFFKDATFTTEIAATTGL